MSLRWKIVGGFGLLLGLIMLLGWVTLSLFGSLRTVQRSILDDAVPGQVAATELVRSYTAQSAAVRGYLINPNQDLLDRYSQEVATSATWERRAEGLFRSRSERTLLQDLVAAGRSFHSIVDADVLPLAADGRRSLAFSVLGREGDEQISTIEQLGEALRASQAEVLAGAEEDLLSRSRQTLVTLLVVTLGALLVGIVVAVVLPRRLVADLARLVDAARAIGRGDFDQRVTIRSGDEVEELAVRFGEMQSGLKRLQQLALQDRELEIAASIQQNLLPRSLPETPGVRLLPLQRQANLVGGDWYDAEFSSGVLTVVVGDASGKGIGAALMATVALSVLRAERGLGAGGKRVIGRANSALLDATDPDSFTTLIYASLEAGTGKLTWLNMGHPSPFLLRGTGADGPEARGYYLEGPRNKALGWFDDPGLQETVIRLSPRDRLVLYTDGFLEAKSPEGETFGEHRFATELTRLAPLGSEGLAEGLVRQVERFAAGKLDDDLTMLVIEFQGAPLGEGVDERLTEEEPWHSRR